MCGRVNFREEDNKHLCDTCAITDKCDWFRFCQMNTEVKVCDDYVSIYEHKNLTEAEDDIVETNKYIRDCKGIKFDVYDVLKSFDVRCPALQHLTKKALCTGIRGHKNKAQDLQDILDSAIRAQQLGEINE